MEKKLKNKETIISDMENELENELLTCSIISTLEEKKRVFKRSLEDVKYEMDEFLRMCLKYMNIKFGKKHSKYEIHGIVLKDKSIYVTIIIKNKNKFISLLLEKFVTSKYDDIDFVMDSYINASNSNNCYFIDLKDMKEFMKYKHCILNNKHKAWYDDDEDECLLEEIF